MLSDSFDISVGRSTTPFFYPANVCFIIVQLPISFCVLFVHCLIIDCKFAHFCPSKEDLFLQHHCFAYCVKNEKKTLYIDFGIFFFLKLFSFCLDRSDKFRNCFFHCLRADLFPVISIAEYFHCRYQ
jgi:hypothetical protein